MIALLDYGAGNLTSVRKALTYLAADVTVPAAPADLAGAAGIIVPGVGHFDRTRLLDAPWRAAIDSALERGAALLGICLGLQWLFEGSREAPDLPGLGVFAGVCVRLTDHAGRAGGVKVPHVGWNSLTFPRTTALMHGVAPDSQVYFTHSYAAPVIAGTAAITTHGIPFTSAVERGRIAGVQFHPEKSGDVGLRILQNWIDAL